MRTTTSREPKRAGLDRLADLPARALLGLGRDRILQIEDHGIDRQRARLLDGAGVGSRHVEHAAARSDGHGVVQHYAALRLASISLRLIRHSAIWMALSAAPLRRLSETTHIDSPLSTVGSVRMRLI